MKKWKNEDAVNLRKHLEALIPSAIQDVLGYETIHRVLSSSIQHTDLQPTGDLFTITAVIQTSEKKKKPADVE